MVYKAAFTISRLDYLCIELWKDFDNSSSIHIMIFVFFVMNAVTLDTFNCVDCHDNLISVQAGMDLKWK